MSKIDRVVITGCGIFCPIGCEPDAILASIRAGKTGIQSVTRYSTEHLASKFAAELPISLSSDSLAIAVARQAWMSAGLSNNHIARNRIAVCLGGSGAGLNHHQAEHAFSLCFQPHEQAAAVAKALGTNGPVVMFTSASAGSSLALAHAMNLLRSYRCDLVIAGGAECLSKVNHECMDSMRFCCMSPCSPFSGEPGLTVGEGGALFVLERLNNAQDRGAVIHAEIYGFGVTQDAYDVVGGDPSGDGLARSILAVLDATELQPSEIDWIKANGSSNREQDIAETLAIKRVFADPPPVTSVESFIGHANGAAPALGLGVALIAFKNGIVPPTINFVSPRTGCDLDYVPNQAREMPASRVLASSVGFGGLNAGLIIGTPRLGRPSETGQFGLCITGVGVVSAFGNCYKNFIVGLQQGLSGISRCGQGFFAGFVQHIRNQRLSAKTTLLQHFSVTAAQEAFESASLTSRFFREDRIGLFVGLTRGSAAARSQYAEALNDSEARRTISKLVLRMGRFTVASALSQQFRIKGYGATISEGFGAGLHALANACIHLESSHAEDALLVVAADETGVGPLSSLEEKNWIAAGSDGCYLRPYDPLSGGTLLGEGAVGLVVERTSCARKRGAKIRAHIEGVGLSSETLACAMNQAIQNASRTPNDVTCAYGNGNGIWSFDKVELSSLQRLLPNSAPIGCVNSGLGFAESTSGLFQVAAAIHALSNGEIFSANREVVPGSFPRQLLTSTSEGHRSASVMLSL